MSIKISVIVPVYNVEKYLSKCIESIINQKEKNIEILLIDDGSTDKSGEICDKYSELDNRIRVIHKKNEGVSIARNIGLNMACGKYIAFVDGDDFIHEDIYTTLLNRIETLKYDLVMCRFYRTFINGENVIEKEPLIYGEYDKQHIVEKLIFPMIGNDFKNTGKPLIMGTTCRCIYKKDIIRRNEILFPKIKIAEDMIFNLNYLGYCNYVYVEDKPLYFYRYNKSSTTRKYIKSLWDILKNQLDIVKEILFKFNLLNQSSIERLNSNTLYFISWCFTNECHPDNPKSYDEIIKEMNLIRKDQYYKEVFRWKNLMTASFKERCIFACIKLKFYRIVYIYNNKKLRYLDV